MVIVRKVHNYVELAVVNNIQNITTMAKRGRKPKTERKGYFYEEQEEAVKKYLEASSTDERNEIFNSTLKPAFTKMIESIIRRYKLYVPEEEFKETFDDTLSFLSSKMANFDPEKGCRRRRVGRVGARGRQGVPLRPRFPSGSTRRR